MRKKEEEGRFYLYPDLLFEIFCIALIVVEIVAILAILLPPPVLREVDLASRYSPKPAWYFLPLYELVKLFPGRLVFLGASVIPLLTLLLVYAVPWLDTSEKRPIRRRPVAAATALLLAAFILFLLWRGWNV